MLNVSHALPSIAAHLLLTPFHLPCFHLSMPLSVRCISAARTENTVTLFCAETKKKEEETPLHQNIFLQSTPLLEP